MTKIYFACSIRAGRDDADTYRRLVDHIQTHATVLTEIFVDGNLTTDGSPGSSNDIYEKDIQWIRQADAVIAEVTTPSLGVGYEIAKAEEWGKPVLCLFKEDGIRKLSAMIDGSPYVTVAVYDERSDTEWKIAIDKFMSFLDHQSAEQPNKGE